MYFYWLDKINAVFSQNFMQVPLKNCFESSVVDSGDAQSLISIDTLWALKRFVALFLPENAAWVSFLHALMIFM